MIQEPPSDMLPDNNVGFNIKNVSSEAEKKLDPKFAEVFDKAYDKFKTKLNTIQMLYASAGEDWQLARKKNNTPLRVLRPIRVQIRLALVLLSLLFCSAMVDCSDICDGSICQCSFFAAKCHMQPSFELDSYIKNGDVKQLEVHASSRHFCFAVKAKFPDVNIFLCYIECDETATAQAWSDPGPNMMRSRLVLRDAPDNSWRMKNFYPSPSRTTFSTVTSTLTSTVTSTPTSTVTSTPTSTPTSSVTSTPSNTVTSTPPSTVTSTLFSTPPSTVTSTLRSTVSTITRGTTPTPGGRYPRYFFRRARTTSTATPTTAKIWGDLHPAMFHAKAARHTSTTGAPTQSTTHRPMLSGFPEQCPPPSCPSLLNNPEMWVTIGIAITSLTSIIGLCYYAKTVNKMRNRRQAIEGVQHRRPVPRISLPMVPAGAPARAMPMLHVAAPHVPGPLEVSVYEGVDTPSQCSRENERTPPSTSRRGDSRRADSRRAESRRAETYGHGSTSRRHASASRRQESASNHQTTTFHEHEEVEPNGHLLY